MRRRESSTWLIRNENFSPDEHSTKKKSGTVTLYFLN